MILVFISAKRHEGGIYPVNEVNHSGCRKPVQGRSKISFVRIGSDVRIFEFGILLGQLPRNRPIHLADLHSLCRTAHIFRHICQIRQPQALINHFVRFCGIATMIQVR